MKKSCPIKSKKPFRKHLLSYIRCIVVWDYIFSSAVVVSSLLLCIRGKITRIYVLPFQNC